MFFKIVFKKKKTFIHSVVDYVTWTQQNYFKKANSFKWQKLNSNKLIVGADWLILGSAHICRYALIVLRLQRVL